MELNISPDPWANISGPPRTKWDILMARRTELRKALSDLDKELTGMEQTECGLTCTGCGELLRTEKDFAAHFTIPDERYLNLGNCPVRDWRPMTESEERAWHAGHISFNPKDIRETEHGVEVRRK